MSGVSLESVNYDSAVCGSNSEILRMIRDDKIATGKPLQLDEGLVANTFNYELFEWVMESKLTADAGDIASLFKKLANAACVCNNAHVLLFFQLK